MGLTSQQKYFLFIAILLGIGIPFLILGIALPNAMRGAIMSEAELYSVMTQYNYDRWGQIPGQGNIRYSKTFFIYNILNPLNVT